MFTVHSMNKTKMQLKLTISLGDEAAWMNQSCVRKSFIDFFSDVPGKRRIKPLVEPKYCHESPASRSKLFANIGSKCVDHATDDCILESIFDVEFIEKKNKKHFVYLKKFQFQINCIAFVPLKLMPAGARTELCVKFTMSFSNRRIGFGGKSFVSSDK